MKRTGTILVLVLLTAAIAGAGLYHVPGPEQEWVVSSGGPGGEARVEAPGLHWGLPFQRRLVRYSAAPFELAVSFRRDEGRPIASREGVPIRLEAVVRLSPDPRRLPLLTQRLREAYRDPNAVASCGHERMRAAAAAMAYDDLLALAETERRSIESELAQGAAACGLRADSVIGVATWPEIYPEGSAETEARERRILVIGLDGADWAILDPLAAQGKVPNLSRLVASGVRARMKSISPMLSPIIWTSMATGKQPEKHGIIDFLAVDSRTGESIPVTSTMRKARAFWEILSNRGISVGTVGWWATWPAEPVLGFQVSDRVAYQLFGGGRAGQGLKGRTWPEGLILSLARLLPRAKTLADQDVIDLLGRPPDPGNADEQALAQILTSTRIYHLSSLALLKEYRPRVFTIYYEGTDTVAHLFMRYAPPRMSGVTAEEEKKWGSVVERYYQLQDRLLGEILRAAGQDDDVIVVSDHGFRTGTMRPQTDPRIGVGGAADWHRKFGIFAASGPDFRRGESIDDVSVLDLTPTLLALLGLPSGSDMDGKVVSAALEPKSVAPGSLPAPIATYEGEAAGTATRIAGSRDPAAQEVEREMIARLTALGYIGQTGANAENNQGITLLRQGRFPEAEAAFRAAMKRDPAFRSARVNIARALMAMKKWDGALAELEKARRDDPNQPEMENLIGNVQMEKGDLAGAEATFRRALGRDAGNPNLWNSLGIVLSRRGKTDDAMAAYRRVVEIEGDYAEAINNIGLLLRDQGRPQEAIAEFERAIRADGDFPGSYNNLGLTYQDLGDHEAALKAYDSGLAQDPENPVILTNRGSAYLALGRNQEAKNDFEKAVALDPNYPSAHNNLGALLGILGDAEAEFEEYLKAIELDPGYTDARFNLALNLMRRGRDSEARKALLDLIEVHPDHARAHMELGVIAARQGRADEAIAELSKARALAPRWPQARNALARALASAGRIPEALKEARASLALDPNQTEMNQLVEKLSGSTSGSTP